MRISAAGQTDHAVHLQECRTGAQRRSGTVFEHGQHRQSEL